MVVVRIQTKIIFRNKRGGRGVGNGRQERAYPARTNGSIC